MNGSGRVEIRQKNDSAKKGKDIPYMVQGKGKENRSVKKDKKRSKKGEKEHKNS